MQYGFVINQETCIGCHACTVACKAENDVPVGGFRTNVKYVDIGKYPKVKRSFLVQRCNHCTDAPCVAICPVNALKKRDDGIVDIDRDACIGCRACMQACPYDALYLNEDLGAVEKCHFCAHRVEKGLQPACVTVCPVGAIIPGDFHDPESEVSLLKRAQGLKARRPEQGTGPNVFYVGASDVALNPGSAERPPHYMWTQRRGTKPEPWPESVPAEENAREVLNSEAKVEWGWPVALYLLTKGIAAGAAMIAPFFGLFDEQVAWWLPETIALVFTLVTVFLLIEDLKKPLHFYKLFTRPNWNSWLVKGGIVLTVFSGLSAAILAIGLLRIDSLAWAVEPLRWLNAAVATLVAGYTAFLFKQCKGRDLWEADGLLWHLIAQSVTAGAASFHLLGGTSRATTFSLCLGGLALAAMQFMPTANKDKTSNFLQAKGFFKTMTSRFVREPIWMAPVYLGIVLTTLFGPANLKLGNVIALVGLVALVQLFLYERAFVRSGQLPPLS